jgi:predicted nucleotidyltransferase component of viral defense system
VVASFADLLATKLTVVLQRVEAKDYRDVAAMMRSGLKPEFGLAAARRLFG